MSEEHLKTAVEVYTRQHEFYAEQTALALQFPIKLVLTLNGSAFSVLLLLIRGNIKNSVKATILINTLTVPFCYFFLGISFTILAIYFQWRLYDFIMHRKRNLLKEALESKDLREAMTPFCNEPKEEERTHYHMWCFYCVVLSFFFFLIGVYTICFTI
jgi:hypothetical protein